MPFANANGSSNIVSLPAGQSVCATNPGGLVVVFGNVPTGNQPDFYSELGRATNGSVLLGPYSADRNVRIDCGPIGLAEYQFGVNPAMAGTPWASAGMFIVNNGSQNTTNNAASGRVNVIAAQQTCTVTCSACLATSHVVATVEFADVTLKSVFVVPSAGSFIITGNAVATAATRIRYTILNG